MALQCKLECSKWQKEGDLLQKHAPSLNQTLLLHLHRRIWFRVMTLVSQRLCIYQAQHVNEWAQNLISLAKETWVVLPLSQHQSKPRLRTKMSKTKPAISALNSELILKPLAVVSVTSAFATLSCWLVVHQINGACCYGAQKCVRSFLENREMSILI